MPDREKEYIVEKLQESLEKAENDGCIYAKIRRPIVFSTIALLKEQEAEIDEISDEYLDLGKEMAKQPKIVRCKDCKHYTGESCRYIDVYPWPDGDWFCACGEKREEKTND